MGCGASRALSFIPGMGCLSAVIHPGAIYEPSCIDKLTDAQLDEFREAFNMFDKDGGGSIDASELRDLMISVGQNCTEMELKEMVKAADADGTGDIDFLEFAVLMAHKMTDENKDDTLKKAFAVFDASGDGFISAQEMRKIMFNLGENLQQEDVEAVIGEVDVDGDGQINYQEFAKILSQDGDTPAPKDEKPSGPILSRRPSKESFEVTGSRDRVGISIEGDRSRKSSKEDMQVVNHS
jgi:calmodulin